MSTKQDVPVSVLGKAQRILHAFTDDAPPVIGLSELARRAGLPKATVYRLATELTASGLLERDDDAFRLGSWLFELGQRVPRYRDLCKLAMPFMEDLYVATGATVHLGVRDGGEIVYALKVHGHGGVDEPSRVAGRILAHCTATGRALLSVEPPEVLERLIASGLEPMTAYTSVTSQALRAAIVRARRTGAAVEREEVRLGHGAVASPVFGIDGPVAAIGVACRTSNRDPTDFQSAVRTSAMALTRTLRASGAGLTVGVGPPDGAPVPSRHMGRTRAP